MQIKDTFIEYAQTRRNILFVLLGTFGILLLLVAPSEAINSLDIRLLWLVVLAIIVLIGNERNNI